jgi:hypothetical protein
MLTDRYEYSGRPQWLCHRYSGRPQWLCHVVLIFHVGYEGEGGDMTGYMYIVMRGKWRLFVI